MNAVKCQHLSVSLMFATGS